MVSWLIDWLVAAELKLGDWSAPAGHLNASYGDKTYIVLRNLGFRRRLSIYQFTIHHCRSTNAQLYENIDTQIYIYYYGYIDYDVSGTCGGYDEE